MSRLGLSLSRIGPRGNVALPFNEHTATREELRAQLRRQRGMLVTSGRRITELREARNDLRYALADALERNRNMESALVRRDEVITALETEVAALKGGL